MKMMLQAACELMSQTGILSPQINAIKRLSERLEKKELVISVIGQFKRGKTSLINHLLGADILPVGIIPLTTVVTMIHYGDKASAILQFQSGERHEIGLESLPDYISEHLNSGNHKRVDSVILSYPSPLLSKNIVLVDTPGVGSLHRHNTDASYAFVEKSDAVLFMLSVDSPVNELEKDFLLTAKRFAPKFYFVVNKIDVISQDELKEYLDYCEKIIRKLLDLDQIILYPVSSKTGEGIEHLFSDVKSEISGSVKEILEQSIGIKAEIILQETLSRIKLYSVAMSLPTQILREKTKALRKKQKELDQMTFRTELLVKQQSIKLLADIEQMIRAHLPSTRKTVLTELERAYKATAGQSSKKIEKALGHVFDTVMRKELERINNDALKVLEHGYSRIVVGLAEDITIIGDYLADLVKDSFGIDYRYHTLNDVVSERSDFYLRVNQTKGGFLIDTNELIHLLPRKAASQRIYNQAVEQLDNDLQINTTNMLYNYRYKIQESVRSLMAGVRTDVNGMQDEVYQLLTHVADQEAREEASAKQNAVRLQQIESLLIDIASNLSIYHK